MTLSFSIGLRKCVIHQVTSSPKKVKSSPAKHHTNDLDEGIPHKLDPDSLTDDLQGIEDYIPTAIVLDLYQHRKNTGVKYLINNS